MIKRIRNVLICFLVSTVFVFGSTTDYSAYVMNGWVFPNPFNIKYEVSSSIGQYSGILCTYTETWNTYCSSYINLSYGTNDNIYFYGNISYDNQTYAVTHHISNEHHTITFYKAFAEATNAQKNEVIVHEVGHALGLAHCQESRNAHAVMRATGFNGKAYPLLDDVAGIVTIYGGN